MREPREVQSLQQESKGSRYSSNGLTIMFSIKLFAREEGEHIFEWLRDEGAVRLLVGLQTRRPHLVWNDLDIDDHGPAHCEDTADLFAEMRLISDDDGGIP